MISHALKISAYSFSKCQDVRDLASSENAKMYNHICSHKRHVLKQVFAISVKTAQTIAVQ